MTPPKPRNKHPHFQLPLSAESLREELLAAAGFDRDARIKTLRRVIETATDDLEATKRTPIVERGRVMDTFVQPDYAARAKAREQLIDLINVPKDHAPPANKLEIPLPPWVQIAFSTTPPSAATPPPIDVTPVTEPGSKAGESGGDGHTT